MRKLRVNIRTKESEREFNMNKLISSSLVASLAVFYCGATLAQQLPGLVEAVLLPINSTSADALKLSMAPSDNCSAFKANPYTISLSQNSITITPGELGEPRVCTPTLARPRREFDLGRLPAGNYTLTVVEPAFANSPAKVVIDKAPFTVTDARANKAAPYVRLDYSGHWWDPKDSGWGLFIWQDAKSATDNILAAWFTYTPDGKPMWYVFQPKWETASATLTADLVQGSRLPGTTSPPPTAGTFVTAGTAKLDFTNFGTADEGKIIYTFANGVTITRNIQRFRP
jgi:hypothetical protein